MNEGKKFEQDFKNSVNSKMWFYRFKDGTGSWEKDQGKIDQSKTRFQPSNICDCAIYQYPNLFLIELKTLKENSISLSMIRPNQIKELSQANVFAGIFAGFIVNFRKFNETYFLPIDQFNEYVLTIQRKSIPIDFFRTNDKCILIAQRKLIKNFRYNIELFIKEVKNESI